MRSPTRFYTAFSGIFLLLQGTSTLAVLFRGGERGAFWFDAGFGAFYTALALFGMITNHPAMLRLQPFDHPFHLLLGIWGLFAAGYSMYRSQNRKAASL